MPELIDKQAALDIAMSYCPDDDGCCSKAGHDLREMLDEIEALPIVHIDDMAFNIQNEIQAKKPSRTVEITFVRRGRWIECDYKTLEHGEIESAYKAGLCCSECRTGFKKNRMTYKAFCPACGARMDEPSEKERYHAESHDSRQTPDS